MRYLPVSSSLAIADVAKTDADSASCLFGMLARRRVWLPTWRGCLVLIVMLVLSGAGLVKGVHPFLALNAPVSARVMVVEGWIPMSALAIAAHRFRSEGYDMICTVGGAAAGEKFDSKQNDAVIVADQFLEMGLTSSQVFAVPSGEPSRDRTYTSARALRDWFSKRGGMPFALNVVTVNAHSRRSRLLFEKAFGDSVAVGVISIQTPAYDASHWWRYSEGVKEVLSEGAAYLYARFLFNPS